MSADLLRKAAATLRDRAKAATPGAWKLWGMSVMADQDGTSNVDTAVDVAHTYFLNEDGKPRTFNALYIALMQPGVGLALADWLDTAADDYRAPGLCTKSPCGTCDRKRAPLNVARLIVGEQS